MQRRAKNRIGLAAVTVGYCLLVFPLSAHANAEPGSIGAGSNTGGGDIHFGVEGACSETGGGAWGGYTAEDDDGFFALQDMPFWGGTTSVPGTGESVLNLCGNMSRQPSDDAVIGAVGAPCESGGELVAGVPAPTSNNGQGRMIYGWGHPLYGHYHQLRDVRMAFTPASGIVFKGEYTSSPDMPSPTTGTVVIYAHMGDGSPLANNCLLVGGAMSRAWIGPGSFALIPD